MLYTNRCFFKKNTMVLLSAVIVSLGVHAVVMIADFSVTAYDGSSRMQIRYTSNTLPALINPHSEAIDVDKTDLIEIHERSEKTVIKSTKVIEQAHKERLPKDVNTKLPAIKKTLSPEIQSLTDKTSSNVHELILQKSTKDELDEHHETKDTFKSIPQLVADTLINEQDSEESRLDNGLSLSTLNMANNRYSLGSDNNPMPKYPYIAIRRGWQGEVILGVHVNPDGSIKDLSFVKSTDYNILNKEAFETVKHSWKFLPLNELASHSTVAYIEVPIQFRLANR